MHAEPLGLRGAQVGNLCFNLTSNDTEILTNWHLRRVVPRLEILLFTGGGGRFSTKQACLGETSKKVFNNTYTSTVVVSPDLSSTTPSILQPRKTPEITDEDTDDPSRWRYPSVILL